MWPGGPGPGRLADPMPPSVTRPPAVESNEAGGKFFYFPKTLFPPCCPCHLTPRSVHLTIYIYKLLNPGHDAKSGEAVNRRMTGSTLGTYPAETIILYIWTIQPQY